jgi:hypothetical protein
MPTDAQAHTFMFRSLPLRAAPVVSIDRDRNIIYGVSAAQAVEALGHDMVLDGKTIGQLVEHGNAARNGVKSRFTHPGLSSTGLGKYLGRMRNFRQEGDKAIADLHLADSAFKTPDGDLGTYVMDMAENDPDMFGMSVVIQGRRVWTLADGTEMDVEDFKEGRRPENATTEKPVVRIKQLHAVDAVDEPAANRDGLFAARHLWATNSLSQEAFDDIDEYLSGAGVTPQRAFQFALAYFTARGVDVKEFKQMAEVTPEEEQKEQPETTPATPPASEQPAEESPEPDADAGAELAAQLAELKAQFAAMAAELAAKGERETELSLALSQADERLAEMERAAMRDRFAALAAGWYGDTSKHVAMLEKLAALDGEAGESFQFYVQTQNALAEQVKAAGLFGEKGTDKPGNFASATEQVAQLAAARAKEQGISLGEAMKQVFGEQPGLYEQYVVESVATKAKGRE